MQSLVISDLLHFFESDDFWRFSGNFCKKYDFKKKFFFKIFFQNFFFLLKMDLETSTKASGCLKNHKFLIYDEKQHPENFWFRGC